MLAQWTLAAASAGAVAGIAGAVVASRLIQEQLWGVDWFDSPIFISSTLTLLAIAMVATLMPALRATRIDPAATIRCD
jgi:ABC-type lipoprotein release transport system permease subunit